MNPTDWKPTPKPPIGGLKLMSDHTAETKAAADVCNFDIDNEETPTKEQITTAAYVLFILEGDIDEAKLRRYCGGLRLSTEEWKAYKTEFITGPKNVIAKAQSSWTVQTEEKWMSQKVERDVIWFDCEVELYNTFRQAMIEHRKGNAADSLLLKGDKLKERMMNAIAKEMTAITDGSVHPVRFQEISIGNLPGVVVDRMRAEELERLSQLRRKVEAAPWEKMGMGINRDNVAGYDGQVPTEAQYYARLQPIARETFHYKQCNDRVLWSTFKMSLSAFNASKTLQGKQARKFYKTKYARMADFAYTRVIRHRRTALHVKTLYSDDDEVTAARLRIHYTNDLDIAGYRLQQREFFDSIRADGRPSLQDIYVPTIKLTRKRKYNT